MYQTCAYVLSESLVTKSRCARISASTGSQTAAAIPSASHCPRARTAAGDTRAPARSRAAAEVPVTRGSGLFALLRPCVLHEAARGVYRTTQAAADGCAAWGQHDARRGYIYVTRRAQGQQC